MGLRRLFVRVECCTKDNLPSAEEEQEKNRSLTSKMGWALRHAIGLQRAACVLLLVAIQDDSLLEKSQVTFVAMRNFN